MMTIKNLLIYTLCLMAWNKVAAQKSETVIARVYYTYTNQTDTLSPGKTRKENMVLFLGKNTSLYSSLDKIKHEIADEQKFKAQLMANAGNGRPTAFVIDDRDSRWMNTTTYLYFVKENKWYTKEFIALQAYLTEETPPAISWNISKDTLTISGIKCRKATATFKDKKWIAWFTETLAFPGGPGQLYGLPGLIIDAQDEQGGVHYAFAGLENAQAGDHIRLEDITKQPGVSKTTYNPIDQLIGREVGNAYFENIIRLPPGAILISRAQLEKLKTAYKKDPVGFTKTRSGY